MRDRRTAVCALIVALALAGLVVACAAGPAGTPAGSPSAGASAQPSSAASPTPTEPPTPSPAPTPTPAPTCGAPATVTVLGGHDPAWPSASLVACLGRSDVRVTGWLADAWGIGGTGNGIVPAWIGEWSGLPKVLWLKPMPAAGCVADTDCVWMFLFAPEAAALPLAPDRWVTVTGHFYDPAAGTCQWVGPEGAALTATEAVEACRGRFVVTAIEDAPAP